MTNVVIKGRIGDRRADASGQYPAQKSGLPEYSAIIHENAVIDFQKPGALNNVCADGTGYASFIVDKGAGVDGQITIAPDRTHGVPSVAGKCAVIDDNRPLSIFQSSVLTITIDDADIVQGEVRARLDFQHHHRAIPADARAVAVDDQRAIVFDDERRGQRVRTTRRQVDDVVLAVGVGGVDGRR